MNGLALFFRIELRVFSTIWIGQLVTRLGSAMTRFALMIWAYDQTGNATTLAMLGFYSCISFIVVAPFSGVLVDRWDRRKVMMVSDFGAGIMTIVMLIFLHTGSLQIWHLYLAESLSGFFESFQSPAYSASVSLLVPENQLTRANGLNSLANYVSSALSPIFAGLILSISGLTQILVIDICTMLLALCTLAIIRIPKPECKPTNRIGINQIFKESRFGLWYIFHRPGLAGIMIIHFFINLFGTITYFAILSPMILARTGGDTMALSTVQTSMGIAGILGALLISIWGGSGHRIRIYLLSTTISFFFADMLFAIGQSLSVWILAGVIATISIPFITSPYYALWQQKIPAEIQGRVFSVRNMFQIASQPIGFVAGGLLADFIFEPAMIAPGKMAMWLGPLIGTGAGAGMAAMFLGSALLGTLTGLAGFLFPAIRNMEKDIPNAIHLPKPRVS
ncbi:MAG: MFS transporter [Anaerolineaceae bacterium]|nr:MFS transporter [Anaerolineaceae bacterium]